MTATTPLWKRIVTGVLLYGIFCLFLWSFLLVETRSHNKLTHEPIAVAHLAVDNDRNVRLALSETVWQGKLSTPTEAEFLGIEVLLPPAGDAAVTLWQRLCDISDS
ncbi:hypothetical protein [uncultured Ruminococcus sp.]|uniref:hypothetical protein n=1 Tax=uncultured Ruminococcus sp. TaxID=165186 RepID=UPI00265F9DA0|nr:hypothetical protein [uncultured Ruminococcus sp.]